MILTRQNEEANSELPYLQWREWLWRSIDVPQSWYPKNDDRKTGISISPEIVSIASADIKYLSSLIRDLEATRGGDECDEYGRLCPTDSAYHRARHLLVDAAIFAASSKRQMPHGCVSIDSEGGVRVEWVYASCSVHLTIPATDARKPYIYHEVQDVYATEEASPERLAHWLSLIS